MSLCPCDPQGSFGGARRFLGQPVLAFALYYERAALLFSKQIKHISWSKRCYWFGSVPDGGAGSSSREWYDNGTGLVVLSGDHPNMHNLIAKTLLSWGRFLGAGLEYPDIQRARRFSPRANRKVATSVRVRAIQPHELDARCG